MKCPQCETIHSEPAPRCRRCSARLPSPRCTKCKASISWGKTFCDRHRPDDGPDEEYCPACGVENEPDDDYCADCGAPMAVITRIVNTGDTDKAPDPWRVYGVETSLVGRDDELQLLKSTLDDVQNSRTSRVAIIAAGQGLGKSRLLAEFENRLESSFTETAILHGVCRPEVGGAFSVISRMLRSRFYIPDENSKIARRRLFEAVDALVDSEAEDTARLVAELVGLSDDAGPEDTTAGAASPRQMEDASFRAVADLLRADADRNPLLFVLDDFHLAPDTTGRLIEHLVDALSDAPVFFVFGQTESEQRPVGDHRLDLQIELTPLSDGEVSDHIDNILRLADEVPDRLTKNIVDAALGNPLAVEEMLRIFISEGVIDTRRQPWRIDAQRIDDVELPTTVEETVKARLDGLTKAERRGLEMAACVGTLCWGDLLRCLDRLRRNSDSRPDDPWLIEDGDAAIDDVIESLERKDMIRRQSESRLAGHEEFFFKHRLERQSLYQSLSTRLQKRNHRLIAQWVERECANGADGAAEFIARHYRRAGILRRAARHYLDAADDARSQHANQKSLQLYLEALGCLSDADMDLKMRACHGLGSLHALLGEHRQARTYFRDMARYAWLVDDRAKAGAALNRLGRTMRDRGQYDTSLNYFRKALSLFRQADDDRGVSSTLDDIGKIRWIRGDQSGALKHYESALEMRRSLGDKRSIALSLSHIGSLRLSLGDLDEARDHLGEALELRKQLDDPRDLASSYNDAAGLHVERGDFKRALPLLEKGLDLAQQVGDRGLQSAILNNTGEALIGLKRRDEARQKLTRAREIADDIGQKRVLFDVLRNLAQLAVSEAKRSLALDRIDGALAIARELDSRSYIALAALTRAEIHAEYVFDPALKQESIDEATDAFQQAISLLEDTRVDIQLAHALSSFGHFLVEIDEPQRARSHLKRASKMFDQLEMPTRKEETRQLLEAAMV